MKLLLPLLLLAAAVTLPLGFTLPMVEVDRLFIFVERPSLFQIIDQLWATDERALAGVVAAFSVVLPTLKLLTLFVFCFGGPGRRSLLFLEAIAKWSMMDVMLVAIVIFAAKTSGLATAVSLPGIWCYGAAATCAALAAKLASFMAGRDRRKSMRKAGPAHRAETPIETSRPSMRDIRAAGRPALNAAPRRILARLPPIPTSRL